MALRGQAINEVLKGGGWSCSKVSTVLTAYMWCLDFAGCSVFIVHLVVCMNILMFENLLWVWTGVVREKGLTLFAVPTKNCRRLHRK